MRFKNTSLKSQMIQNNSSQLDFFLLATFLVLIHVYSSNGNILDMIKRDSLILSCVSPWIHPGTTIAWKHYQPMLRRYTDQALTFSWSFVISFSSNSIHTAKIEDYTSLYFSSINVSHTLTCIHVLKDVTFEEQQTQIFDGFQYLIHLNISFPCLLLRLLHP